MSIYIYFKNILQVKLRHSKNKNTTDFYRSINAIMKGYQPIPNLLKDKSNMLENGNSILKWTNR